MRLSLSSLASLGPFSPYPALEVPPLSTSLPTPLPRASPKPSPLCDSRLLGNVSGRARAGDTMKARDQVGREGNKGSACASGPSVQGPFSSKPRVPLQQAPAQRPGPSPS